MCRALAPVGPRVKQGSLTFADTDRDRHRTWEVPAWSLCRRPWATKMSKTPWIWNCSGPTSLGRWEQEVSFCGDQEDIIDQVAFKSLLFSVTLSHRLIPLCNFYSPVTTSHMKESQATNGRVAESLQYADRWVNSSSLTGFLLLPVAIHLQRSQPAESAFQVKCTARPRAGGRCPEGPPHGCPPLETRRISTLAWCLRPASHH